MNEFHLNAVILDRFSETEKLQWFEERGYEPYLGIADLGKYIIPDISDAHMIEYKLSFG